MFILTLLPWPHLIQKFAVGTASAPQFEQNIWELKETDGAMLDLTPTAFARTISVQDPRIQHLSLVSFLGFAVSVLFCRELFGFAERLCFCGEVLVLPWVFAFAANLLVLPWAFWFCRELFGFAVRFWFCRELFGFAVSFFGFAVSFLVLPWVFGFAVSFLVLPWAFSVLPWAFCFCREVFVIAVNILVLPWGIWYCRDTFVFAVRYLLLPWQLWATVRKGHSFSPYGPTLSRQREKHRITRHCSAKLQTTKQTLTTSKHSIEFTCSDFPCHFKVNRDKLALTNRRWMCKKGKRLTITADF